MTKHRRNSFIFFLGGQDLEMATIRELLEAHAPGRFHDRRLCWGARASAYRREIDAVLTGGMTPVLIELEDDLALDPSRVVVVDHHGERAGADRPTSLEQVFQLLALPAEQWTRWHTLVAANDRAHIPGLLAAGASASEIREVRARDRAAQGISVEQEAAAAIAANEAEQRAGGRCTLVRLPHARTAAVADRLAPALGGPGYENLLIFCPDEVAFFGTGDLVLGLDRAFPGGWYGGDLPKAGFWGRHTQLAEQEQVLAFLEEQLDAGG